MSTPAPTPATPPSKTLAPASTTNQPPVSPIAPGTHGTTFAHKTSSSVSTRTPFIDTSAPAINDAPVELDGGAEVERKTGGGAETKVVSPGLGVEEEIEAEFLGDGGRGVGRVVMEERAAMLARRTRDPGVIVDVPREPTAEEVLAAKATEGAVTPRIPADGETR